MNEINEQADITIRKVQLFKQIKQNYKSPLQILLVLLKQKDTLELQNHFHLVILFNEQILQEHTLNSVRFQSFIELFAKRQITGSQILFNQDRLGYSKLFSKEFIQVSAEFDMISETNIIEKEVKHCIENNVKPEFRFTHYYKDQTVYKCNPNRYLAQYVYNSGIFKNSYGYTEIDEKRRVPEGFNTLIQQYESPSPNNIFVRDYKIVKEFKKDIQQFGAKISGYQLVIIKTHINETYYRTALLPAGKSQTVPQGNHISVIGSGPSIELDSINEFVVEQDNDNEMVAKEKENEHHKYKQELHQLNAVLVTNVNFEHKNNNAY